MTGHDVPAVTPEPGSAGRQEPGRPGLLGKLLAAVRPEFRQDILVFGPDDLVFGRGGLCRVPGCGRPAGITGLRLCRGHHERWASSGRPDDVDGFAVASAGRGWHGHTPPPGCQVSGCGYGASGHGLCQRHARAWGRDGRPAVAGWVAGVMPASAPAGMRSCPAAGCTRWAQPASAMCHHHQGRWNSAGRPDLAGFTRDPWAQPRRDEHRRADLTALPRQLRLEVQYALQCRNDDRTAKVELKVLRALTRQLAGSGVSSLLDRTGRAWRDDWPPVPSSWPGLALLRYAHRAVTTLAEGEGWDCEYPRDTWHLRRLGISSSSPATLQFGGISQPWLKDLAKRHARWRLSTGMSPSNCYCGVRAVTRFSAFLTAAAITEPGQAGRDVLERHLAVLHRELAGRELHRESVAQLGMFLRDIRRHQWGPAFPAGAMVFPEDHPALPEKLPRHLEEHIMAQVELPANLARLARPDYQLITLILIRCGLRVNDAARVPADCLVRDADGAPYLRYWNRKMKREALAPLDEEIPALISAQLARCRERWPEGTPVLFPRPDANIDGTRPVGDSGYRDALYQWLLDCDVRDERGQPVHLTPHQWRHTLGTRLINRDVPQHIVQKILDHDSPAMTAHYARISDKTVREHWEKARKVSASGQPVTITPRSPLSDAAWTGHQVARATQALPNGYCQLPMVKTCPHANACLTCPMFVTTAAFLPQHRAQQAATLQLITAAEAAGHTRVAEMNKHVAVNLAKIITALEDGHDSQQEEETAHAS